jgi:hypothetical protein
MYEELAFHLDDSSALSHHLLPEMGQYPWKSIRRKTIKYLAEELWMASIIQWTRPSCDNIRSLLVGWLQAAFSPDSYPYFEKLPYRHRGGDLHPERVFGLDRCIWSGWGGLKQYVWTSIVSYNLLVRGWCVVI